ncbi:MAG: hypothetical protein CMG55_02730 [Candidatus Marinimicrobia bacterium]|nr:hypothetical protein [Candidatus Neomarinimicrobiota bacterium]
MSVNGIVAQIIVFAMGIDFTLAQVDVVGDQNFFISQNESDIQLPLFSNLELYSSNSNINKAVIVVHGQNRNADDYYNSIYAIASDADLLSETVIIAPQFLTTTDLNYWQLDSTIVFWSGTTPWSSGGQSNSTSQHPRDYEISSYTVMDSLISHLLFTFPNIQDIVLIGNSAGGQYVNRYAAGSNQEGEGKIHYIISAPSSYVYFDEYRYHDYQLPFTWIIPEDCSDYNDYKYGLDDLNNYMGTMGTDSIRARYSRRDIKYLIGTNDLGGTQDCPSMTQGGNRFERSIIYFNYLQHYFGSQILDNHQIALIPNVGHDYNGVFSSDCGQNAIFSFGDCEQFDNLVYPHADFSSVNNSGEYPHSINFMNESVPGTHSIQQLVWNIDNETVYSDGSISYNFIYPGLFDVRLIAIDQIGLSDTVLYESLVAIDTLYGDIDWDTEISENDVTLILQHITGDELLSPLQQATGDVSNSLSISSFDASLILQYLSGNIENIPINNMNSYNVSGHLNTPVIYGQAGEIITVPISLVDAINLYSFTISFEYDNTQLESASVYTDAISEYGFMIESIVTDSGSIIVTGASAIPFAGETLLFNLYFIMAEFADEQTIIQCNEFMANETISSQNFNIVINQSLNTINAIVPDNITLYDNFPNPFNNNTVIRYYHNGSKDLSLYITDIKGSLIKYLHDAKNFKGMENVYWDGTNRFGLDVRSGIYFYTLETGNFKKTKKMLLLK